MQRYGFTRVEVVSILAVTLLLAAALVPASAQLGFFGRVQENNRRSACAANLKALAVGIQQYRGDWDEAFPTVTGGGAHEYGWAVSIQPYTKSTGILQCPGEKNTRATDPRQPGYTDYWYNRNLSRVYDYSIRFLYGTFLLGDGDGGYKDSNARYAINVLPRSWVSTAGSPARRHLGGGIYAFTDGHIKWLQPRLVTTARADGTVSTFKVK